MTINMDFYFYTSSDQYCYFTYIMDRKVIDYQLHF